MAAPRRVGAQRRVEALRSEVDECVARLAEDRDEHGHRLAARNGYHEPQEVLPSAGIRTA